MPPSFCFAKAPENSAGGRKSTIPAARGRRSPGSSRRRGAVDPHREQALFDKAAVFGARRQLRHVVRRRVRLEPGDLTEVVDGMAGVGRRPAHADQGSRSPGERRVGDGSPDSRRADVTFQPVSIPSSRKRVRVSRSTVGGSPLEASLLEKLARSPRQMLSREELSRDVSKQSAMETGHEVGGRDQGHATETAEHQSVSESHEHGQGYGMEH